MTKKEKFIHGVGVMLPIVIDVGEKLGIDMYTKERYKLMFSVMSKAYNITEDEVLYTGINMGDKIRQFIEYQLYVTNEKPVWYHGEKKYRGGN